MPFVWREKKKMAINEQNSVCISQCTRVQPYQMRQLENIKIKKDVISQQFPGGPVVSTLIFHYRVLGLIPSWGTKILQAAQHSKTGGRGWDGGYKMLSLQANNLPKGKAIKIEINVVQNQRGRFNSVNRGQAGE